MFYDWKKAVKNLIQDTTSRVKLERLGRRYSLLAPAPFHFPQFSKCDGFKAQPVLATGLEMDMLHDTYGMPREIPQMIATLPGIRYGEEFLDFTIEMFGLMVDANHPNVINRTAVRAIGENAVVSNADPDTIPLGAGLLFSMTNAETGETVVKIAVWRWRVFLNDSSLCLENNWHRDNLIGGGWVPYILGIVYDNPEKMVADTIRFAPAFKLCNLVEAELDKGRGGDRRSLEIKQIWNDENILKSYARLVTEILPTWRWIKSNAASTELRSPTERRQEWVSTMWQRDEIKPFAARYPKFTKEVLARAVDNELNTSDREPVSLACWHAALEVEDNINGDTFCIMDAYLRYEGKLPAPSTLVNFYKKGKPLLNPPV